MSCNCVCECKPQDEQKVEQKLQCCQQQFDCQGGQQCCQKDDDMNMKKEVREFYADVAVNKCNTGCGVSCCGCVPVQADKLATQLGYSVDDLKLLPEGANMGLSCGNPAALAALKPGEVVLDLGSGGGFDVFVAGLKIGAQGRAIGVDMTPQMIEKARKNAQTYFKNTGLQNVEFRLGEIEHLPVADNSVDVVISNCVLNLSTDKEQVWHEIYRVLKPNGRIAISDMALIQPLPQAVLELASCYSACVGGAALIGQTMLWLNDCGFTQINLTQKADYVKAMIDFEDPFYKDVRAQLPENAKPDEYITSLEIKATKPAE